MTEPSATATAAVVAVMVGSVSAVIILIVAIGVAVVFAVRGTRPRHAPVARPGQPIVIAPTDTPPTPMPAPVAVIPPPPPTVVPVPVAPTSMPAEHGPFIASMSPTQGNVGDIITLHGRGLANVDDVILFPQHGGTPVETALQDAGDREVTFSAPAVEKPAGFQNGDGYYVGVFSKTGVCLLVDSSFRSTTPTDSVGATQDSVHVKFKTPLVGGSHLLVFADTGATVSVGTDCIVLLRPNCLLKDYGGGCKIFYMPPLRGMGINSDGLIPMTDIRLSLRGSRLMLKPLGDPGLPPDPN